MKFADNSVRRHIVAREMIGINKTHCGQYYNPCYDVNDERAAVKMPLCKICKKMALSDIKKMED